MSGQDASSAGMPWLPFPRRCGVESDESLVDALLDRQPLPADAPEQLRAVAEMLASLADPAELGELAGEAAARSAFARGPSRVGSSAVIRRSARRRPSWLRTRVSPRLAAGLVAAAVGLGGGATAYAGVLPAPIQDLAHHILHALPPPPASHPKPQPTERKPHATSRPATPAPQWTTTGQAGNPKRGVNAKGRAQPNGWVKAKGRINAKGHAEPKCHPTGHPQARHGTAKALPQPTRDQHSRQYPARKQGQ
jgi:hypothetical protein